MKKLLISSLLATLLITACQKQPEETQPAQAENAPSTEATADESDSATDQNDDKQDDDQQDTQEDDHDHDDTHAEDDHNHAHDHSHDHDDHDDGQKYTCDNSKTVSFVTHDHEGELESHLTLDDIVYDLHPDTKDNNAFTSNEGIQSDAGMLVRLKGDDLTVHTWSQDKGEGEVILTCKAG